MTLLVTSPVMAADASQGSAVIGAFSRGMGFLVGVGFALGPARLAAWKRRREALLRVRPGRGETPAQPLMLRAEDCLQAELWCPCGGTMPAEGGPPATVRFDGEEVWVFRGTCPSCGETTRRYVRHIH